MTLATLEPGFHTRYIEPFVNLPDYFPLPCIPTDFYPRCGQGRSRRGPSSEIRRTHGLTYWFHVVIYSYYFPIVPYFGFSDDNPNYILYLTYVCI
jgi:hypothetical protein